MTAILSHLFVARARGGTVRLRGGFCGGKPVVSVYTYIPMSTYEHTHSHKRM